MILRLQTIHGFLCLAAAFFYLPLLECQKPKSGETITRIRYSTTGGRSGNYESLEMRSDSVIYMQATRGNESYLRQKTPQGFWKDLTGRINLADFDKVKSNGGHSLYDGIDITLEIETTKGKHTLVNGNEDSTNYEKLRPFTGLLDNKLEDLREAFNRLPK